nr:unknown [Glycine max]
MSVSPSVSICWKVLMDVLFGNLMFLLTFFFMVMMLFHVSITITRCIDLLLALMISSYFKIFFIAMMVIFTMKKSKLVLLVLLLITSGACLNVCDVKSNTYL